MKIKVFISREFDTDEWREEDSLFPGLGELDPDTEIQYAINMFAEDIDYLVKYNEVAEAARVEILWPTSHYEDLTYTAQKWENRTMTKEEIIALIQDYKQPFVEDLDSMGYNDPTLYDYAEGIIDACDFILSKIQ